MPGAKKPRGRKSRSRNVKPYSCIANFPKCVMHPRDFCDDSPLMKLLQVAGVCPGPFSMGSSMPTISMCFSLYAHPEKVDKHTPSFFLLRLQLCFLPVFLAAIYSPCRPRFFCRPDENNPSSQTVVHVAIQKAAIRPQMQKLQTNSSHLKTFVGQNAADSPSTTRPAACL